MKIHLVYSENPSEVLTHLKEIAKDLNIELQQQFFKQQYRFNNKDLIQLEQQFDALQINPIAYDGSINILESSSIREEVNEVARQIIKDTRDKQYRYQDIAILYRDESLMHIYLTLFFHSTIFHLILTLKDQ